MLINCFHSDGNFLEHGDGLGEEQRKEQVLVSGDENQQHGAKIRNKRGFQWARMIATLTRYGVANPDLWYHGCWCGSGDNIRGGDIRVRNRDEYEDKVVDKADACCRDHDFCYDDSSTTSERDDCDVVFAKCLQRANTPFLWMGRGCPDEWEQ